MNLIDTFNINKKDIITIVGAGGKTSLMYSASSLYRNDFKVLVTTTTKIYVPEHKYYDEIIMLSDEKDDKISRNNIQLIKNIKKGIYLVGNNIKNNKIQGLNFKQLDKIIPYFDLVLIEGDGSKEKPLKGWNDSEPVIYNKTTKTIGVVDIKSIDLDINEENIHRLEQFLQIMNDESPYKVNINVLKNIILNKKGLFKYSKGDKTLFINKVEDEKNKKNAIKLIEKIKNENSSYIDDFVYGSIFNNEFIKG